jgi:hypothetical protein
MQSDSFPNQGSFEDSMHSRRSFEKLTHQIALNHIVSGLRVSWKMIPAITETWW